MRINNIQEFGNLLAIQIDDGALLIAYPTNGSLWYPSENTYGITKLQHFGDQIVIILDTTEKILAYKTQGTNFYLVAENSLGPVTLDLIDTISPGHSVTNPGGTVASGWQWHIDNNSGRGGVDWNYNFANFTAPGAGTVSHFDLTGVGMVVRLVLDVPVNRINPQLVNDEYGPMTAIWFQHCSASVDGHAEQGDIIGTSGDGYGDYGAHLHVHGMINNGSSAPASVRCNFWGFV